MNKRKKSAKCVGNHLSIYTSNRFSIHAELRVWPLDQSKSNIQSHFSSFLISAKPWGTYLAPELLNAKLCSPASCFNWCWPSCCIQWVQSRLQQKITLMKTACAPEKQNNEGKKPSSSDNSPWGHHYEKPLSHKHRHVICCWWKAILIFEVFDKSPRRGLYMTDLFHIAISC